MNPNDLEQGTVPLESSEYYDPSSMPRFVFTNVQAIDLSFCPSLPQFVVNRFFN